MPHWIIQPWQRSLSKTASGKPGAVHTARARVSGENLRIVLLMRVPSYLAIGADGLPGVAQGGRVT